MACLTGMDVPRYAAGRGPKSKRRFSGSVAKLNCLRPRREREREREPKNQKEKVTMIKRKKREESIACIASSNAQLTVVCRAQRATRAHFFFSSSVGEESESRGG